MSSTDYTDIRAGYTPKVRAWQYWFLIAALLPGPLYVLLLPVLVG
jgi:hypothetical protein